ncbi:Uncharacterised protein [Serratia ficaria]|uniref:hypothetical protein n=1 Tax=Serratia ficaria TaxID=61651 RepID=UPI002183B45E|nr:hypothetical protein [Serratia ficaria]CAI2528775.1 Uncharacterised protein [Serratia ficaria]CAI2794174.1 Uncharacterised protein [Serratia ficaria]
MTPIDMIKNLAQRNSVVNSADVLRVFSELEAKTQQLEDLKATAPGLGQLPPLTPELASILGRPNFQCYHLALALRAGGHDIPRKAEAEQAAVIYFMLGHYLEHGEKWSEKAEKELQRLVATGALE